MIHLAGKANSAADAISRTEGLETDPLTVSEADRYQDDTILDLRLDCAEDSANAGDNAYADDGMRKAVRDEAYSATC